MYCVHNTSMIRMRGGLAEFLAMVVKAATAMLNTASDTAGKVPNRYYG